MVQLDRTQPPALHWGENVTFPRFTEWEILRGDLRAYALPSEQGVQKMLLNFSAHGVNAHPLVQVATAELLLRGSNDRGAQEVNYMLDLWGTMLHGVHSRDRNLVTMQSTKRFAHQSIALLQDLLHAPSFEERVLENWRAKQLASFHIAKQRPSTVAAQALRQHLYPSHPYGYVPVEEDFNIPQRDSLQLCWQHSYTASRCTLFYTGEDGEQMRQLLVDAFGKEAWGNESSALSSPGAWHCMNPGGVLKNESVQQAQSALLMGRLLPNMAHIEMVPLAVAVMLLGGYFGSRLIANLREEHGYTYGVHASIGLHELAATITINSEVGNEFLNPAVEEIHRELILMQQEPPTPAKLHEVKSYMVGELLRRYDGHHSAVVSMMHDALYPQRGADYQQRWLRRLMETTSEEVHDAARQWLAPEAFTLSVAGPAKALGSVSWPVGLV